MRWPFTHSYFNVSLWLLALLDFVLTGSLRIIALFSSLPRPVIENLSELSVIPTAHVAHRFTTTVLDSHDSH